ncbi:MAG: polysaccharide deacetylase family protein [Firmicutes bacterium]|nr:polysaccharide deacetylase family protein [Bacillota bacterium]
MKKLFMLCILILSIIIRCGGGIYPSLTLQSTPKKIPQYELTEYRGTIYHAFFHFLIAFPKTAFSNPYGHCLNRDTITAREFWQALEEFYINGFILIDINDTVIIDENGGISKKPYLMLPPNTKPLILSFDDINYYPKNLGYGTVDKIVLDEYGRLATSTSMPDGTIYISRDNCAIPLLEQFIEQNPNFSPFKAKGTLALTGFAGILGYRTQAGSLNRECEIKAVIPIIDMLLANGWSFASHSYGHGRMNNRTLEQLKQDTRRWDEEVRPLVGDNMVYVFPYGEYPSSHQDPRFQYLIDFGFRIFCGVGIKPYFINRKFDNNAYVFMDRAAIDGFTLRNHGSMFKRYYGINADFIYNPCERIGTIFNI